MPTGSASGTCRQAALDVRADTARGVQVSTPTLGVTFANDSVARGLKLTPGGGALIQAFDGRSAARKAGLLATRRALSGIAAGDVITAVAGQRVRYPQDVDAALDEASVGDAVRVKFLRGIDAVRAAVCLLPAVPCVGAWQSAL